MMRRTILPALAILVIGACVVVVYGSYVAEIIRMQSPASLPAPEQAQQDYQQGMAALSGKDNVAPDLQKALTLITHSAEQGYAEAQFVLGNAYYHGAVAQDYRKAYLWFSLAADNGYPKSAVFRYEVGGYLSPAEMLTVKQETLRIQVLSHQEYHEH